MDRWMVAASVLEREQRMREREGGNKHKYDEAYIRQKSKSPSGVLLLRILGM